MKYKAAVFLAALALPGLASAAERTPGTYVGIGAGANFATDSEVSGPGTNVDQGYDTGHVGVLSLGHGFENGFRFEAEVGERRNSIDSSGNVASGGATSVLSGMLNGYYDFNTGTSFIPYLGAGVGGGAVSIKSNPVGSTSISGRDTAPLAQAIAGVGVQMTENWMGTLEYRYLRAFGLDYRTAAGNSVDVDYASHAVLVGLRYTFGEAKKPMAVAPTPAPMPVAEKKPEPAPAPAPAPVAPAVARNYIVFFDWNKADITPEALAILRSAAENAKTGNISRIEATGHADRSGTTKYNLGLSQRRALAVQQQLAKLGIPTKEVATAYKGEAEPLVLTDDGVREPQNRRVEIVFP